jgi:hypothetical protein
LNKIKETSRTVFIVISLLCFFSLNFSSYHWQFPVCCFAQRGESLSVDMAFVAFVGSTVPDSFQSTPPLTYRTVETQWGA